MSDASGGRGAPKVTEIAEYLGVRLDYDNVGRANCPLQDHSSKLTVAFGECSDRFDSGGTPLAWAKCHACEAGTKELLAEWGFRNPPAYDPNNPYRPAVRAAERYQPRPSGTSANAVAATGDKSDNAQRLKAVMEGLSDRDADVIDPVVAVAVADAPPDVEPDVEPYEADWHGYAPSPPKPSVKWGRSKQWSQQQNPRTLNPWSKKAKPSPPAGSVVMPTPDPEPVVPLWPDDDKARPMMAGPDALPYGGSIEPEVWEEYWRRITAAPIPKWTGKGFPPSAGRIPYTAAVEKDRPGFHVRWSEMGDDGKPAKQSKGWGIRAHSWYVNVYDPHVMKFLEAVAADLGIVIVVVCEGEKDAVVVAQTGRYSISTPNGAGNIKNSLWNPLADLAAEQRALGRDVVVLINQDYDSAGYSFGDMVVYVCETLELPYYRPSPHGLPHGDSFSDHPELLAEHCRTAAQRRQRGQMCGMMVGAKDADGEYIGRPDVAELTRHRPKPHAETIPVPARPQAYACRTPNPLGMKVAAAQKHTGLKLTPNVVFGVACGECDRCKKWAAYVKGHRWWKVAQHSQGEHMEVRFKGFMPFETTGYVIDELGRKHLAHNMVWIKTPAPTELRDDDGNVVWQHDPDGPPLFELRLWYRYPLHASQTRDLRKWIDGVLRRSKDEGKAKKPKPWYHAHLSVDFEVREGLTIGIDDFVEHLPMQTLPGLDDDASLQEGLQDIEDPAERERIIKQRKKRKRTCGFKDWAVRYPGHHDEGNTFTTSGAHLLSNAEIEKEGADAGTADLTVKLVERDWNQIPVGTDMEQLRANLTEDVRESFRKARWDGEAPEGRQKTLYALRKRNVATWLYSVPRIARPDWEQQKERRAKGWPVGLPGFANNKLLELGLDQDLGRLVYADMREFALDVIKLVDGEPSAETFAAAAGEGRPDTFAARSNDPTRLAGKSIAYPTEPSAPTIEPEPAVEPDPVAAEPAEPAEPVAWEVVSDADAKENDVDWYEECAAWLEAVADSVIAEYEAVGGRGAVPTVVSGVAYYGSRLSLSDDPTDRERGRRMETLATAAKEKLAAVGCYVARMNDPVSFPEAAVLPTLGKDRYADDGYDRFDVEELDPDAFEPDC